ncbi:hypothetical protein [Petrimonas mucosa]|uniref:hypothetical protein n=1 Tax=Petrimonas mucosa TaxID=1642646 RepID=UPI0012B5FCBB|nr:hypothetical protein [Petrimonas mucosa]
MKVGKRWSERNRHGNSGGCNRGERCGESVAKTGGSPTRSMRVGCRQREREPKRAWQKSGRCTIGVSEAM